MATSGPACRMAPIATSMTDGCIKVFTVKDTTAEPTGFIFAPDG